MLLLIIINKAGETMSQKVHIQKISNDMLRAEYEGVYHFALTFCKNETDAQDITQQTFLNAMKSVSKFKGDSSLYTWLCSIAKNLWIDHCKKYGREVSSEQISERIIDDKLPVEQYILQRETSFLIHKILHQLNDPYKEVFSLRVFGQLSFSEIAKLFAKTESWARVTYYRAKTTICQKLRKDDNYEQ